MLFTFSCILNWNCSSKYPYYWLTLNQLCPANNFYLTAGAKLSFAVLGLGDEEKKSLDLIKNKMRCVSTEQTSFFFDEVVLFVPKLLIESVIESNRTIYRRLIVIFKCRVGNVILRTDFPHGEYMVLLFFYTISLLLPAMGSLKVTKPLLTESVANVLSQKSTRVSKAIYQYSTKGALEVCV